MLALLVDLSPAPLSLSASPLAANTSWDLLSVEDIGTVGAVILDALGRLKHMGAIAETHAALQAIAEKLFKLVTYLNFFTVCSIKLPVPTII